jgi:hypothetical protein
MSSSVVTPSTDGYYETISDDGLITLVVIDDEMQQVLKLIRDIKSSVKHLPKKVIGVDFCRAHEYFSQPGPFRSLIVGGEQHFIDERYTLVLLDLQADEGALVWDEDKGCVLLDKKDETHGGKILKQAFDKPYIGHIWIWSGHLKARIRTLDGVKGVAHISMYEKGSDEFNTSLNAAIRDWPITLDKIDHDQWRSLGGTLPTYINHWPDKKKSDNENIDDPELWLRDKKVHSYSLREILLTSGYPPPDPHDPGKWMRASGLLPAWRWIASQRQSSSHEEEKLICSALRYFRHVAELLSDENIYVSITPHFKHLRFNPYPLANLLEAWTLSLRNIERDHQPLAMKAARSNDCYLDVELWHTGPSLLGRIKEGFIRFDEGTFPLNPSAKPGGGMQSIMNFAGACGIPRFLFCTRTRGDKDKRTVHIDCSSKSVSEGDSSRVIDLGEDEVFIEFEFPVGDYDVQRTDALTHN